MPETLSCNRYYSIENCIAAVMMDNADAHEHKMVMHG